MTLLSVTEFTNWTNTWVLQTWQVVACCPVVVVTLSFPRQPPAAVEMIDARAHATGPKT